jgi:Protein of unknown function (DUF1501)
MGPHPTCPGPVRRREFLRLGLAGLGTLTWPGLLRLRAGAPARPRADTALLVVWLHGGASHLETYDPKPDAPAEYRGPYRAIDTAAPGVRVSELLPGHARVARRFALLRSLAHTGPCHDSGPQQLFTSVPTTVNRLKPDHPDLFGWDFGRTPKVSYAASTRAGVASGAAGVTQPGRDHDPETNKKLTL